MGILERFSDIMGSNVNALLDKMEDPEKMIDQNLRKMREDLAEAKKGTAQMMASVDEAKDRLVEKEDLVLRYQAAAENALRAGDEASAREALQRKQDAQRSAADMQERLTAAESKSYQMQQMYEKLVRDVSEMESRREDLKSTAAMAKSQENINRIMSGSKRRSSAMESFEKMEDKVNRRLREAEAEAELGRPGKDDILEKYGGPSVGSVDDELSKLKASMGL